jgi:hypothetical protein
MDTNKARRAALLGIIGVLATELESALMMLDKEVGESDYTMTSEVRSALRDVRDLATLRDIAPKHWTVGMRGVAVESVVQVVPPEVMQFNIAPNALPTLEAFFVNGFVGE